MTKARLFLCLAFILALLGCSKNNPAPAKVSGSLTYNGKPIQAGAIAFHTAEGTAYPAQIDSDGTYTATDLPEGEFVVTVDTAYLNPAKKGNAGKGREAEKRMKMQGMQQAPPGTEKAQPYLKIPEKYSNPKTSTLTATLTSGRQVVNLELKD